MCSCDKYFDPREKAQRGSAIDCRSRRVLPNNKISTLHRLFPTLQIDKEEVGCENADMA